MGLSRVVLELRRIQSERSKWMTHGLHFMDYQDYWVFVPSLIMDFGTSVNHEASGVTYDIKLHP